MHLQCSTLKFEVEDIALLEQCSALAVRCISLAVQYTGSTLYYTCNAMYYTCSTLYYSALQVYYNVSAKWPLIAGPMGGSLQVMPVGSTCSALQYSIEITVQCSAVQ